MSVSNDVILSSELEERYKPEAFEEKLTMTERNWPTTYVIVGGVVAVVVVASAASILVIRSRRKA